MPSSGASSSSSSTTAGAGGTRREDVQNAKKTLSDLLVRSAGKDYDDWLAAMEKIEAETRAICFQKLVVGSMVNAWQFSVFHVRKGKGGDFGLSKLPPDVYGVIRAFVGPVFNNRKSTFKTLTAETLVDRSEQQRARDVKRAVEHVLDLLAQRAAIGSGFLVLSREMVDAIPKMSDDSAAPLDQIFAVLDSVHGYSICDGTGMYFNLRGNQHRFSADAFPFRMVFNGAENPADEDAAYMAHLVKGLPDVSGGGRMGHRNVGLPVESVSSCATASRFMLVFEQALRKTREEVLQWITGLAEEAFSRAELWLEITQEVYEAQAPKLPDGRVYPMRAAQVNDMHPEACEANDEDSWAIFSLLYANLGLVCALSFYGEDDKWLLKLRAAR
ncbi:unnamed protein product [Amoebophrya sp. A120]|nr:unnamed protein product [Amoebophrya sp. A120]|eukprot:GSA120T00003525001.1